MFGIIYISWNSFTGKLIALLHWSKQATNLVTWLVRINSNCAQEKSSYELWPGFKLKLINSKMIAKKIGGLVHGIRIQLPLWGKSTLTDSSPTNCTRVKGLSLWVQLILWNLLVPLWPEVGVTQFSTFSQVHHLRRH